MSPRDRRRLVTRIAARSAAAPRIAAATTTPIPHAPLSLSSVLTRHAHSRARRSRRSTRAPSFRPFRRSLEGAAALWDVAAPGGAADACVARYAAHQLPVWDVAFAPPSAAGHYFATASYDRTACLWATDRPQARRFVARRGVSSSSVAVVVPVSVSSSSDRPPYRRRRRRPYHPRPRRPSCRRRLEGHDDEA